MSLHQHEFDAPLPTEGEELRAECVSFAKLIENRIVGIADRKAAIKEQIEERTRKHGPLTQADQDFLASKFTKIMEGHTEMVEDVNSILSSNRTALDSLGEPHGACGRPDFEPVEIELQEFLH